MKLEDINIRDPFILPHDGTYYMYGTVLGRGKGFYVYQSKDLEMWSGPQLAFELPEGFWATKDFWAPEVHKHNGKFYMFATMKSEEKCRGTQILVAEEAVGPFEPITEEPQTPRDWECLDGTLYLNKEGVPYMVFCHEWLQIMNGTMCYARLSNDFKQLETDSKVMFAAHDYEFVTSINLEKTAYVTDGPFLYRTKNGELLLLWSSQGKKGYFTSVLKSDNGELDGKWIPQTMLFEENGGHAMIFQTFEGNLKLCFHAPNSPDGAERAVIYDLVEIDDELVLKQ